MLVALAHKRIAVQVHITLVPLITAVLIATGCGQQNCTVTAFSVTPPNATADHAAAAPDNQVQFFAAAIVPKGCMSAVCVNCFGQNWTVSDPVNVSISNNANDNGTAVCKGATNGAATITATITGAYGSMHNITGTTTLICR
jgi:hypothetical protein